MGRRNRTNSTYTYIETEIRFKKLTKVTGGGGLPSPKSAGQSINSARVEVVFSSTKTSKSGKVSIL